MQLVDAHCHFDFPFFDGHRETVLAQTASLGVCAVVIPGVRRQDWQRVESMADAEKGLWYCLGIHPWFIQEHGAGDLAELERLLSSAPQASVGLGECGLDALKGDLSEQEPWFEAQIDIAQRLGLALVIHSVKSHDLVHSSLKRAGWNGRALLHGFSGSYQQAQKLVDLGCYIGVGGVITHDRARKTRDTIARLPADALVLETDAPDMAPAGVAKGQNSPIHLPEIFEALAELRSEPRESLAEILLANTAKLYRKDPLTLVPRP